VKEKGKKGKVTGKRNKRKRRIPYNITGGKSSLEGFRVLQM
jgi:hypothetical protein